MRSKFSREKLHTKDPLSEFENVSRIIVGGHITQNFGERGSCKKTQKSPWTISTAAGEMNHSRKKYIPFKGECGGFKEWVKMSIQIPVDRII